MSDQYGLVVQGDDEANNLRAHVQSNAEGTGHDFYNIVHGAGGGDTLKVDAGLAHYTGAELYGEDDNDTIFDGARKDTLSGGAGDDEIHSDDGGDVIDGGDGTDTLFATGNLDRFTITGIEELVLSGPIRAANFDFGTLEGVAAKGGNSRLSIEFVGQTIFDGNAFNTGAFALQGSDAADVFDTSAGSAKFYISAGGGNDTVISNSADSSLNGGAGDDMITAGDGKDRLDGGSGNDTIQGGGGNDIIISQHGDDVVFGGDGNDRIRGADIDDGTIPRPKGQGDKQWDGGAGNDTFDNLDIFDHSKIEIEGGDGKDTLEFHGDASNMEVHGIEILALNLHLDRNSEQRGEIKASADFLDSFERITAPRGYAADITLSGGGKFVLTQSSASLHGEFQGSGQDDEIDLSNSHFGWTVNGGHGDDIIKLGAGGYASGYIGNDIMFGGTKNSELVGGAGDDTFVSGTGDDEMTGDDGADTFVFQRGGGRHDTIEDFESQGKAHDTIDLSANKTIKSYDDLVEHHVSQESEGISIDLGHGDKVYVYQLFEAELDKSLFIL